MTFVPPAAITPESLDLLFREARTTYNWLDQPVPLAAIEAAWDLARLCPTAMNCLPLRIKVIATPDARARLVPCMAEGNQPKVAAAPMQLVLAASESFYLDMPRLFPAAPGMEQVLADNSDMARGWASNNAWLQAGYLILALRAVGLACGPENGADFSAIDREFFPADCRSFLVVNVGYAATPATDFPRGYRFAFKEIAEVL